MNKKRGYIFLTTAIWVFRFRKTGLSSWVWDHTSSISSSQFGSSCSWLWSSSTLTHFWAWWWFCCLFLPSKSNKQINKVAKYKANIQTNKQMGSEILTIWLFAFWIIVFWYWHWVDSNHRPGAYETPALTGWATVPRDHNRWGRDSNPRYDFGRTTH